MFKPSAPGARARLARFAPAWRFAAAIPALCAFFAGCLEGCSACDSSRGPKPSASAHAPGASASAPASSAVSSKVAERRSLPERAPLDVVALLSARGQVVEQVNAAQSLLAKSDSKGSALALERAREKDPLGGVVALALARAALLSGDAGLAAREARIAVTSGGGRKDVSAAGNLALAEALEKAFRTKDAEGAYRAALAVDATLSTAKKALERLRSAAEAPAPPSSTTMHAETPEAACKALEAAARSGKLDLTFSSGADAASVECAVDGTLEVDGGALSRALVLRLDVRGGGGEDVLMWAAVAGPQGLDLEGPVASVFRAEAGGAVNDVIIDLQKIDVLPGGAPEIVVKIVERRTLPDVALGEALELDQTRAILLSVDRGGVIPSREVVLSSRSYRFKLDPKAKGLPRGFSPAPNLGKASEFSMKVAWGGPNSMTLTQTGGDAKPKVSGEIVLFP